MSATLPRIPRICSARDTPTIVARRKSMHELCLPGRKIWKDSVACSPRINGHSPRYLPCRDRCGAGEAAKRGLIDTALKLDRAAKREATPVGITAELQMEPKCGRRSGPP